MTLAFVLFLAAALLPLFFGSTRTALLCLAMQAIALAAIRLRSEPGLTWLVHMLDLVVVRALLVPWVLSRVAPPRSGTSLVAPDLLKWSLAGVLVILGFWFASRVTPDARLATGTAIAGILVGLFVLASQEERFGQAIGALFIENAVALAEATSPERAPWPIVAALALAFAGTVIVFAVLLRASAAATDEAEVAL